MAFFPHFTASSSINQPKMRQEGFHLPSPSPSNGNPPSPPAASSNSNGSSFDLFLHSNSNDNNHSQSPPPLPHSLSHNRGSAIDFDEELASLMTDPPGSSHHGGLSVLSSERSTHLADHELREGGLESMDHHNVTPPSHPNGLHEEYRPHNIFDMGAPSSAMHFSTSHSHNNHQGAHAFSLPSHHSHRGELSLSPPLGYSHHADTFGTSVGSIGSGGGRDGFTGHFNSTIPPLSSAGQHDPHDNFNSGGFAESPSPSDTMSVNLNGVGSRPGTGISGAGARSLSRSRSRTGSGPGVSRTAKNSSRRRESFSYHRSTNSASVQNGNTMAIFGSSNDDSPPGGLASPISPPLSATTPSFGVPPPSRPQAIVIPSQNSHHSGTHLRGPISPISFGHSGHAGSPASVSSVTTTGTGGAWFLNGSGSATNGGHNLSDFPLPTPESLHSHHGMAFGNGLGISPKDTHVLPHSLSSLHSHSNSHHGHGGHTLPTLNLSNLPPSGSGAGTGSLGSGLSNSGNGLGGLGFGPNGSIHNGFSGMGSHGSPVGGGGSSISVTGYGGSNGIGGISSIGGSISGISGNTNGQAGKNEGTVDIAAKQAALLSEKRRRRRESHNAVERRRRDNINEKISELATLIPEVMLNPSGTSANANSDDIFAGLSSDNVDVKSPIVGSDEGSPGSHNNQVANPMSPGADSPTAQGQEEGKESGPIKANKGMILRKSVDYIRYLQQLVEAQAERNRELEKELEIYRSGSGARQNETLENDRRESFTDEDFMNMNMGMISVDMSSFGASNGFGIHGLETMPEDREGGEDIENGKDNDMDVDKDIDLFKHAGRPRNVRELRNSKASSNTPSSSESTSLRGRRHALKGSDDGDADDGSSFGTGASASLSASNDTRSASRARSVSATNGDDEDEDERAERNGRDILTKLRPRAGTDAGAKGSGKTDRYSFDGTSDQDTFLKERGRPGKRGSRAGSTKNEDVYLGVKREVGCEEGDEMDI